MNSFLLEYRDPLFGILIFLILVFIVSFFSYWWAYYKKREEESSLSRFFKKFEESADKEIVEIEKKKDTKRAFYLLAKAFEKSGDFEKAIAVYLNLSKMEEDFKNRHDILKKLAIVYFKAGFLEKARKIFLESLRIYPRDKEALNYLTLIYEKLQDYKKANEILESLEELMDVNNQKIYFNILDTVKNQKDTQTLLEIYKNFPNHHRLILEYLFRVNPKTAWKIVKENDFKDIIDILWKLDKKDVDMDIVSKNSFLRELYSAKEYFDFKKRSSIFELDVLLNLKENIADLDFEYVCKDCKNIFPIPFSRCPNCLSIDSLKVELILTKRKVDEKSLSFQ